MIPTEEKEGEIATKKIFLPALPERFNPFESLLFFEWVGFLAHSESDTRDRKEDPVFLPLSSSRACLRPVNTLKADLLEDLVRNQSKAVSGVIAPFPRCDHRMKVLSPFLPFLEG